MLCTESFIHKDDAVISNAVKPVFRFKIIGNHNKVDPDFHTDERFRAHTKQQRVQYQLLN